METQCGSLYGTRTCLNPLICQSGVDWKKMEVVTADLGKVISLKEFSSTGLLVFPSERSIRKPTMKHNMAYPAIFQKFSKVH